MCRGFFFKTPKNQAIHLGSLPETKPFRFFLGMENGIAIFFRKAHAFLNIYGSDLRTVRRKFKKSTVTIGFGLC